jgi:cellulose biosynthesis protein BcsQ
LDTITATRFNVKQGGAGGFQVGHGLTDLFSSWSRGKAATMPTQEEGAEMKSVCFFNNKGGVGKTTLICNISSYLAKEKDLRILLVDADPQCNSTQLILDEEELENLYKRKHRARSRNLNESLESTFTLYDVMQPIAQGESHVANDIVPILGTRSRFLVDLIPGHPKVALLEDQLSQAWVNFGGGDIGGARKTNWNSQLTNSLRKKYDLIFLMLARALEL